MVQQQGLVLFVSNCANTILAVYGSTTTLSIRMRGLFPFNAPLHYRLKIPKFCSPVLNTCQKSAEKFLISGKMCRFGGVNYY